MLVSSMSSLLTCWCNLLLLCGITWPAYCNALPLASSKSTIVRTSIGTVRGFAGASSLRFSVRYGLAPIGHRRFRDPVPVTAFKDFDGTRLPPPCPQAALSGTDEDCLFMNIYTPSNATPQSKLPVMFWVHGGSFIQGSATAYGLDGSPLAATQNIVVVTVQTRLGVLGYMRNAKLGIYGNYGLKDLVTALTFAKSHIAAFGGDPTRVTVSGQSSGAELVKTLLVTPSAEPLFARVILHSAPLDYADQSRETGNGVGNMVATDLECSTSTCLRSRPVSRIIAAQNKLVALGQSGQLPGFRIAESYFRPVVDGQIVTQNFHRIVGLRQRLANSGKTAIMTVMKDDASLGIYALFPEPQPAAVFEPVVQAMYGERALNVFNTNVYSPVKSSAADATRDAMTRLGTDFTWLCPVQQSALNMTVAGQASIYFAQFDSGISYLNNSIPYTRGKATHEDDILSVFGTAAATLTSKQQTLVKEVQARWGAFIRTGSPNVSGYSRWSPVNVNGNLNVLRLGNLTSGGSVPGGKMLRSEVCALGAGIYSTV
ncbi:hypothetical protein ACM66B_003477 [Microbotryomycetes sp. NB124-2]